MLLVPCKRIRDRGCEISGEIPRPLSDNGGPLVAEDETLLVGLVGAANQVEMGVSTEI